MYHKTVTLQTKERWSLPGEGRERRWIEGTLGVCFPLLGIVTLHCQRGVLNHHGSPLGVSRKGGKDQGRLTLDGYRQQHPTSWGPRLHVKEKMSWSASV